MNERIAELAAQAYGLCKTIDDEGQHVVLTDQWNEKFADLILKEVLTLCKDKISEFDEYAEAGDDEFIARSLGAYQCVELIQDTFGIDDE